MDFDDTPDEAAYRARVRSLLGEHAAELVHLDAGEEAADAAQQEQALRRTQRVLADAGLVGVSWAREHGGQAGTLAQQAIVNQELARARVPTLINHIGLGMCGPTVVAHGTAEQHERYLARLLRGRRRSGASCSANPAPAPTSPRCAPRAVRRRRRVGGQRPEGVDDAGARRRPRHPARPHRPRPAQARRADHVHRRHARPRASRSARCGR